MVKRTSITAFKLLSWPSNMQIVFNSFYGAPCYKDILHLPFTPKITFMGTFGWFLRGAVKNNNSIFKDVAQIGGREVNPISKKKKNYFLTKVRGGGGHTTYCQK